MTLDADCQDEIACNTETVREETRSMLPSSLGGQFMTVEHYTGMTDEQKRRFNLLDEPIKLRNGKLFWPGRKKKIFTLAADGQFPSLAESQRSTLDYYEGCHEAGIRSDLGFNKEKNDKFTAAPKTAPTIRATPFVFRDIRFLPRREWLFGRLAKRKELSLTIAPGGVGKTALGFVEAVAMATGKPLTGTPVEKPLRVWVWNGEEPMEEMELRIAGIREHYGLVEDDFGERLFVNTGDDVELVLATQSKEVMIHEPIVDALVAALRERAIDVMIVDPFVSTHNVTENDNNAIQKAATAWKKVAKLANCAIMLSHHSRKLNGQEATAETARGGDSLVAKARIVRALNPMSANEAKKLDIDRRERASIFFNDSEGGKVNMTSRGVGRTWYRVASVPLYNLATGELDMGDEIGVVEPWTPPVPTFDDLADEHVGNLKARLTERDWYASPQSHNRPDWVGVLIAEVFAVNVNEATWKDRAKAIFRQLLSDNVVTIADARSSGTRRGIKIVKPTPVAGNDNTPPEPLGE